MSQVSYFGEPWPSTLCDESAQSRTPVGTACIHCGESIVDGDSGVFYSNETPTPAHRNCFLRAVIGSVAHIQKRCSCFVPGSHEDDPPGLTKRQAADAAVEAWRLAGGSGYSTRGLSVKAQDQ